MLPGVVARLAHSLSQIRQEQGLDRRGFVWATCIPIVVDELPDAPVAAPIALRRRGLPASAPHEGGGASAEVITVAAF